MNVFKGAGQLFAAFSLVALLSACGGGGGGGGGGNSGGGNQSSSSSTSTGGTVENGAYSITVDKSSLDFNVAFENPFSGTQTIKITYSGDGLIAGYPPGEETNNPLGVTLTQTGNNSAELSVRVMFRFQELNTFTRTIRLITGKEDGSKYVTKDIVVHMKQLDGFTVTNFDSTISGLWGDNPGKIDFQVVTLGQSWTVSSAVEGITLSTTKGAGIQTVSVSYDYLKTPITTQSADVLFTAADGKSLTKTINFNLSTPAFSAVNMDVNFPNQYRGQALAPIDIDLGVTKNLAINWQATLPAWLSAKSTSGITGSDKLQLYVDPAHFPSQDGSLSGTVHVEADLLGGKIERDINVNFPYQQTRMQPSKAAFAFSDYATTQEHNGEFWLNVPTDNNTQVVSSSAWLKIDSVVDRKVKFHLETNSLPIGYQTADIAISQPGNNALVPTTVHVGYYKSTTPLSFGAAGTWPWEAEAVGDKLGPWIYISKGDANDARVITKYNVATHSVEKTLRINELNFVGSLAVSDDGQYLYGVSYDDNASYGRLLIINLADFTTYKIVPAGLSRDDHLKFMNIDGKYLVSNGSLFDAFTGNMVAYSGYGYWSMLSQSGEYVVGPGSDSIMFLRYDYNHLTGEMSRNTISETATTSGDKISALSDNGNYLGVLNRSYSDQAHRTAYIYKINVDAQNMPSASELHNGPTVDEAYSGFPPAIQVGNDGRFAIYSLSYGGANKVDIYRADQSLVASYPQTDQFDSMGKSWFYSADDKSLIYFLGNFANHQTLYIYSGD